MKKKDLNKLKRRDKKRTTNMIVHDSGRELAIMLELKRQQRISGG